MLIVPDSTVSLYANIPVSDGQQLLFRNKQQQTSYFTSKRVASKAACSYIRKTGRLRIEYSTSRVISSNYISFTNPSFENKVFYARIIDYEYVNNMTTDIIYQIDWFQSFCFDVDYHACQIIREHLTEEDHQKATDNPWRRDIPELLTDEPLPVGEPLETIYTQGYISGDGVVNGNRFSAVPVESTAFSDSHALDLYVIMQLSQFDYGQMTAEDAQLFLNLWDYYGGNHTSKPSTFPSLFSTWKDHFIRPCCVVGICAERNGTGVNNALNKLNEAIRLLTLYATTGSIVGIYVMPKWALAGWFENLGSYDDTSGFSAEFKVPKLSVRNPKLNTFPFRYLRVKSPKDTKEYRFDLCNAINTNANGKIRYRCSTNFNGIPSMTFAIQHYKNNDGFNYYERLDFNEFPQAGYSVDGYSSYMGGQYQASLMYNTKAGETGLAGSVNASLFGQFGSILGGASHGVDTSMINSNGVSPMDSNPAGSVLSSGSAAVGATASFITAGINRAYGEQELDFYRTEAFKSRGSGDSAIYGGLKRAFVNDQYNPGSSSGYLPYQFQKLNFTIELVELNKDILDKYDTYFEGNGYLSLRNGVPHVCSYMKDGSKAPHYGRYDNEDITYVKTENMQVSGSLGIACVAIENLFNRGVRFVKVV